MTKEFTLRLIKGPDCRLPDREWRYTNRRTALKRAYYLAKIHSTKVRVVGREIIVDGSEYYSRAASRFS